MPDQKLLVFDELSIMYRWHHRLEKEPLMHRGINTSAVHGFFYTLFSMARQYDPTHLAVCAESKGKTFRHRQYAGYKSSRSEKPDAMYIAEEIVEKLCKTLNVPFLRIEGVEADDVLGTLVTYAEQMGMHSYLVSSDKDFGQLVTDNITQIQPQFGGGFKELGPKEVCEKWGVEDPKMVVEILALAGDKADDVPGVKGIGAKGASKLIANYKTAASAYQHRSELTPALERKLTLAKDDLIVSRWLVEIRTDLEEFLPPMSELVWAPPSVAQVAEHLDHYGLNKIKELLGEFSKPFRGKPIK
jgi:DNA polymerase-1